MSDNSAKESLNQMLREIKTPRDLNLFGVTVIMHYYHNRISSREALTFLNIVDTEHGTFAQAKRRSAELKPQ
jgi:hypothetical protein